MRSKVGDSFLYRLDYFESRMYSTVAVRQSWVRPEAQPTEQSVQLVQREDHVGSMVCEGYLKHGFHADSRGTEW